MYNILENDNNVFYDVDDTLIMYDLSLAKDSSEIITINATADPKYDVHVVPHYEHIKRLKQFKGRNQGVIVWSQGGASWAAAVVHALGLNEYVDVILSKPRWIFDDLPISAWLTESQRSYIEPTKRD